eukprot:scaffold106833_cov33-Phaeocystis_antarctica.AAC.2
MTPRLHLTCDLTPTVSCLGRAFLDLSIHLKYLSLCTALSIYLPTGGRTRAVPPSSAVSGSGSALPSEGSSPPHV